MRKTAPVFFFAILSAAGLFAQVQDLQDALNNRQVSLSANGSGGSSGASVTGFLQNATSGTLRINTVIRNGLYLRNEGAGQNMAATGVYLESGEYYFDGENAFIELAGKARTPVIFIAFCADFEKENPSPDESFSLAAMPGAIRAIVSKISRYMADHPDDDAVIAAQIALWISQGETAASIGGKFAFQPEDEALAGVIAGY
ncbi:MAG: hypothetical protein LBK08_08080 [Treponema sp.]|jgi:hypothetical protein|nr:hypothetical protein [Treponema sp.]